MNMAARLASTGSLNISDFPSLYLLLCISILLEVDGVSHNT